MKLMKLIKLPDTNLVVNKMIDEKIQILWQENEFETDIKEEEVKKLGIEYDSKENMSETERRIISLIEE